MLENEAPPGVLVQALRFPQTSAAFFANVAEIANLRLQKSRPAVRLRGPSSPLCWTVSYLEAFPP